jgi:hypothetical protein
MTKLLNFHPILFQQEMVKANLDGRKTETRRIIKPQPDDTRAKGKNVKTVADYFTGVPEKGKAYYWKANGCWNSSEPFKCPYGQPGNILWVRENYLKPPFITHKLLREGADTWPKFDYTASCDEIEIEQYKSWGWQLKPSIHMPKEACRMFLLLKEVKVERLQDIKRDDCIAEGIAYQHNDFQKWYGQEGNWYDYERKTFAPLPSGKISPSMSFMSLWKSINGEDSWQQNPWLWVLKYEVLTAGDKPATIHDLHWALLDRKFDGAVVARSIHNFKHNIKAK